MLTLPAVLTHSVAAKFDYLVKPQADADTVVVDATALVQFDSSALAVLLECRRQALAAGKAFSVRNAPPKLSQLAAVYGVEALIAGTPGVALSTPS